MRCSIVVVAVNVVTRCASIRSTMRAASNFCSTTRWSPASRLNSVANPLVWYIGAITSTVCGRSTGRPRRRERHAGHLVEDRRLVHQDDLGRAGRPAAADAVGHAATPPAAAAWGRGRAVDSSQARSSTPTLTPSITSSTRSRSQSGRSQRTGTGTAPSFHAAQHRHHELGRVAERRPRPRALGRCRAPASARPIWVERRCSSGQVTTVSAPSTATTRTTGEVASVSASCAMRSAKVAAARSCVRAHCGVMIQADEAPLVVVERDGRVVLADPDDRERGIGLRADG